jgi:hypothetical protein
LDAGFVVGAERSSTAIDFIAQVAEREGFEPSMSYQPIHTFQACSLNRSDTSPETGLKLAVTPIQPHLGTRVRCCRCSLPGLTGFTAYRCEGTGQGHHRGPVSYRRHCTLGRAASALTAAPGAVPALRCRASTGTD